MFVVGSSELASILVVDDAFLSNTASAITVPAVLKKTCERFSHSRRVSNLGPSNLTSTLASQPEAPVDNAAPLSIFELSFVHQG